MQNHCLDNLRGGLEMLTELPKPIAAYIAAENGDDVEVLAQCFTDSAVVRDEGQTIKGLAAIKQWKTDTKRKYQHTIEALRSVQMGDTTVVTSRLSGNFPGSPVTVDFTFQLKDNKIASLEIR
jgi:ketosteroid isomerase-like protein